MPRAKRGFKRRRRVNKVMDRAEGFVLGRKSQFRRAAEAVDWSLEYQYRDRRRKKRDMRSLWISRISAACQANDLSYSRLIWGLGKAEVNLNRKVLSDIAIHDPKGFSAIVETARAAIA